MIIYSIDLETTGVDRETNQVLEIGVVREDTENPLSYDDTPKINIIIKHTELSGNIFALNLNARIIKIINEFNVGIKTYDDIKNEYGALILTPLDAYINLCEFFKDTGCPVNTKGEFLPIIAGKNFASFDRVFLNNLFNQDRVKAYAGKQIHFTQRCIDPTNYFMESSDTVLPNLQLCKERAGIKDTTISHRAVEDAWDVIQCIRVGNKELYRY